MAESDAEEMEADPLSEAAAWRVRLSEAGVESTADFEIWLRAAPSHPLAWRAVQASWAQFDANAASPEMVTARRDALDAARRAARGRWATQAPTRRIAAALAVVAAVGALGGAGVWLQAQPTIYETRQGERRTITLADGSKVTLDSASRLAVRFNRESRRLRLEAGQGRFDVAHDVTRPFSVVARDRTVVATGTIFNVDLLGPRVIVTLLEGRVSVLRQADGLARAARGPDPASASQATSLRAGYRLVATIGEAVEQGRIEPVSVERAVAWERGQLVFEDEPLASVAERISRYTDRPVTVSDPGAATMRISGVFTAGDRATFVDTVTTYLPVEATPLANGAVDLRRQG